MRDEQFAVVADADLWDGEMESYLLDGAEVLLIKLDGQYHAYDGRCPHQDTPLAEGRLDGTTLVCGAHEWEFDARTGAGLNPRTACLRRHEVRVVDGQVLVHGCPQFRAARPGPHRPSVAQAARTAGLLRRWRHWLTEISRVPEGAVPHKGAESSYSRSGLLCEKPPRAHDMPPSTAARRTQPGDTL